MSYRSVQSRIQTWWSEYANTEPSRFLLLDWEVNEIWRSAIPFAFAFGIIKILSNCILTLSGTKNIKL